jgi:hypothetical protein
MPMQPVSTQASDKTVVSAPNQDDKKSLSTYPVDWIARGDTCPGKSRISSGSLRSMIPANMALLNALREFGEAVRASPGTPTEVVDNEALDAGGLGSVNDDALVDDCRWRDSAYDGILALHSFGQIF